MAKPTKKAIRQALKEAGGVPSVTLMLAQGAGKQVSSREAAKLLREAQAAAVDRIASDFTLGGSR